MESRACMNSRCGTTTTSRWRPGWPLRTGGVANLCDTCGVAYEQSIFCDMFHINETGWRDCNSCGKGLHCGCIASKSLVELLDGGGVECFKCTKSSNHSPAHQTGPLVFSSPLHTAVYLPSKSPSEERKNGMATSQLNDAGELISPVLDSKVDGSSMKRGEYRQSSRDAQGNIRSGKHEEQSYNISIERIKKEQGAVSLVGTGSFSHPTMSSGSSKLVNQKAHKDSVANGYEPSGNTYLNISLGAPNSGSAVEASNLQNNAKPPLASPSFAAEIRQQNRATSSFLQGQRSRHFLVKPANAGPSTASDSTKDAPPQIRVARPPGEGRGRNQLLPRYWPRITDQELQQISGDSNSKIVPLFEKVLSASDAGRIGRLVLPKACAEAYFPPISIPEGRPLTIQDAKGRDWVFQFRFWPNNNSRMYVLEGVTPCIQAMQLQAGDTVTFSRIDPEGKLVMGFRKANNSAHNAEPQISAKGNGVGAGDGYISGVIESLPSNGSKSKEELGLHSLGGQEKKRSRNLGSKSKRLHIDSADAMELKLTWEEAQDLLRPPPSIKPSIVMIEDHEFEEYEEPPVFGKRTIFTSSPSGGHDQWAQCDNCLKWRRLPIDALLPPRWTCAENSWDPKRCSCSAPDEMSSQALQDLLRLNRDLKKRKAIDSPKRMPQDVSALDALATIAVLGESCDTATPSTATTKHPRHRPGCSCIVCIQPPSGKGPKHKPTCTCNVCMTVRRRFKTLMMRRKKRQSEQEAEAARKKNAWTKEEGDVDDASKCSMQLDTAENDAKQANSPEASSHMIANEKEEMSNSLKVSGKEEVKGQIDLNCDPDREDDLLMGAGASRVSMTTLLQVASLPLETYLKQHGLSSLADDERASPSDLVLPGTGSEGKLGESQFAPPAQEQEAAAEDACPAVDQMKNGAT
ncbi:B3 domain-containing transcription repressor VAL2-like [Nymphaea colorata]|nr:B3 domain-containing transcription repressor VAL2-like [Nymphaea colorata]